MTEAGTRLLDGILPAYRSIDQTLEAVRQREGVTQGSVRLATVHTLSYYFMAEVVAQFVSSREHVNLSVMGRSSPEVVALVESGKADIGFVYDAAVASDALASSPLFDDDMCLIVRRGVDVADGVDLGAMALRLVGFPPHYALRKMIHSAGLQPEFVAEAETIDAMLKLVSSGVGACILPSRIPEKLLADYELRKVAIASPVLRRRVVAITPAQRQPLPLVGELLDCARRIARG